MILHISKENSLNIASLFVFVTLGWPIAVNSNYELEKLLIETKSLENNPKGSRKFERGYLDRFNQHLVEHDFQVIGMHRKWI